MSPMNCWPKVPLVKVATLQRGFDLPVKKRTPGNFPVFAANGVHGSHKESKVKGPGVVTGRSGTIGKVHYVDNDFWPLNTSLYVKDFNGNDPKWIYYMLANFRLERFSQGAGVPTLNRNLVHHIEIPLPPLPEQKRIAAILDKADAIRRKRRQAIKLADDFLRATFLDMFGDPVRNPKGWEVKLFGSVCSNCDSKRIPLKTSDRAKRSGPYPYYGASGIIDYIDDYIFDGEYLLIGEDGANLVARSTPIAFLATSQFWVNNHAHVIASNGKAALQFFEQFFSFIDLKPFISGSAQPKLTRSKLNNIPVPLPPINLQTKYVKIISARNSSNKKEIDLKQGANNLFNSLTQRAFRGEL